MCVSSVCNTLLSFFKTAVDVKFIVAVVIIIISTECSTRNDITSATSLETSFPSQVQRTLGKKDRRIPLRTGMVVS